ncbi:MAG: DUF6057 family protein [Bacteroidales bacterium]|jgi:hypothetical protein|nr:DUF6057 family protein [Bacteroidales bacterium]
MKERNMPGKGKYLTHKYIIPVIFVAGSFLCFGLFLRYNLWFREQLQVFLLTFDHLQGYFTKPAFLASWIGDFLTQFFHPSWGAATVISITLLILWLLLHVLVKKTGGTKVPFLVPLLPVILCWAALTSLEYPVSNVISLCIAISFVLVYVSIRPATGRQLFGIVSIPHVYLTAGSSMWIFAAAFLIYELREKRIKGFKSLLLPLVIVAIAVGIPLILRLKYLLTPFQALTWLSEMKRNPGIWDFLPLAGVIISASVSMMVIWDKVAFKSNSLVSGFLQALVIGAVLAGGILKVYDRDLEKILRLDREAANGNWKKVYELSEEYELRNNIASYFTNMAMAKLGIMPDSLMMHYQPAATGLFIPVNANENYLTITLSNEVYWHLGDVNAAQHSAYLGTIFSPRAENSRLMKRLIEINIVNGQYAVAEKYVRILEKTMFHGNWAEDMRKYLYNEEECGRSEWIRAKRAVIPSTDLLKSGNEYVKTLRMLVQNNPANRMALDYLLCFHLLSRDIPSFESDFEKYYLPGMDAVLPRVYQEGLLINIASRRKTPADYSRFSFSPETVRQMAEYTRLFEESNGKGSVLIEKFGKTYWFYYHFARMKDE